MTWTVVFDKSHKWERLTEYGAFIIEGDESDALEIFENFTGIEVKKDASLLGDELVAMEFSHLEEAEFAACTDRVIYLSR